MCTDSKAASSDEIAVELRASVEAFLGASGNSAIGYREIAEGRCPDLSEAGCHGQNQKVFCDRNALEQILASMAANESQLLGLSVPDVPYLALSATTRGPGRIDAALRSFASMRFRGAGLSPGSKPGAFDDGGVWSASRDYLVFFVLGHEAYHAFEGCPFPRPSTLDAKGDYRRLVDLQKRELFCPNAPAPSEVLADECGLRALEVVNARLAASAISTSAGTLSRALALEFLSRIFFDGLGLTQSRKSRWTRDGYLVPSLRVLAVRRQFAAIEGSVDDPRIGPCGESLQALWESARASRLCVSEEHVLLMPLTGAPFSIFPAKEMADGLGLNRESCLDSTVSLPEVSIAANQRITIRLVDFREDNRHAIHDGVGVNAMISRLPFQVAVAACLGEQKRAHITIHVNEDGYVDSVRSPSEQLSGCLKDAVTGMSLGGTVPDPTPIAPDDDDHTPEGYRFSLEVSR